MTGRTLANMLKLFAVSVLGLNFLSGSAFGAGTALNTTIDAMMMDENYDTKMFIRMAGPVTGKATCSAHPSWDFVIETGTPFGVQMYAILMNAYNKDLAISLLGKNTCDTYAGVETLRRIDLL